MRDRRRAGGSGSLVFFGADNACTAFVPRLRQRIVPANQDHPAAEEANHRFPSTPRAKIPSDITTGESARSAVPRGGAPPGVGADRNDYVFEATSRANIANADAGARTATHTVPPRSTCALGLPN